MNFLKSLVKKKKKKKKKQWKTILKSHIKMITLQVDTYVLQKNKQTKNLLTLLPSVHESSGQTWRCNCTLNYERTRVKMFDVLVIVS